MSSSSAARWAIVVPKNPEPTTTRSVFTVLSSRGGVRAPVGAMGPIVRDAGALSNPPAGAAGMAGMVS